MGDFKTALQQHKECIICYDPEQVIRLKDVVSVISVKEQVKSAGISFRIELVTYSQYEVFLEDQTKLFCFVNGFEITYNYFDGKQETLGKEEVVSTFTEEEDKLISEISEPNHEGHKILLQHVWVLMEDNPDDKVLKALLCDKFFMMYQKKGLIKEMITNGTSSLFNLYLNMIDYLNRHKLNLHNKMNDKYSSKKFKIKDNVITVHQTEVLDKNYMKYGFTKYPDADYTLNYWDDGSFQIFTNPNKRIPHADLTHTYNKVMTFFQNQFDNKIVPLSTIKWVLQDVLNPMVTTTFEEILKLKETIFYGTRNHTHNILINKEDYLMDYNDFTSEQWKNLDSIGINLWDLFEIVNQKRDDQIDFTGIIFYGRPHRPGKTHKIFEIDKAMKLSVVMRQKFIKELK